MNRRFFLKKLPFLALILSYWDKAGASPAIPQQQTSLTIYPDHKGSSVSVPIQWHQNTAYVSARQFAEALQYRTYANDIKRKLVIYLPLKQTIVLASQNPYVKLNDRTLQMPVSTKWLDEEIYFPLTYVLALTNQHTSLSWEYDPSRQTLRSNPKSKFNVQAARLNVRENGLVIRISCDHSFKQGEMSIDMRNDWLHIDLYNAQGDVEALKRTEIVSPAREVRVYQFKELLSVAFRLRKEPLSKELYQESGSNDIVAILRYKETIEEQQLADEPPPPDQQNIQNQLEKERQRWMIDTVVIDPGHGGKDPGAIGVGNLKEKDVVLSIGLKLGEIIQRKMPGINIIYTRRDDRFIELRRRTQIANENNGKIFISIHANANRNSSAKGFETYILGVEKGDQARNVVERENSVIKFEDRSSQDHYKGINNILARMAQSAFMKQSEGLAGIVQDEMASKLTSLNLRNRGVKQAPFWVMVGASMPCILVETGFITNKYEAKLLKTGNFQQKIAEGIFNGLVQYKEDYENAI